MALIKIFGFQLGYGYIADYIAQYYLPLCIEKSVCRFFPREILKKSQVFKFKKVFVDKCIKKEENSAMFGYIAESHSH